MKTNFTLNKSNAGELIKRIKRMLEYTGMLQENGKYPEFMEMKKTIAKLYAGDRMAINVKHFVVTHTSTTYIDKDTAEFYYKDAGIGIQVNKGGTYMFFNYGCKLRFTPRSIRFKHIIATGASCHCIIEPCKNVRRGKMYNEDEEAWAEQYWEDIEKDQEREYERMSGMTMKQEFGEDNF